MGNCWTSAHSWWHCCRVSASCPSTHGQFFLNGLLLVFIRSWNKLYISALMPVQVSLRLSLSQYTHNLITERPLGCIQMVTNLISSAEGRGWRKWLLTPWRLYITPAGLMWIEDFAGQIQLTGGLDTAPLSPRSLRLFSSFFFSPFILFRIFSLSMIFV